jgi:hypothetical protein
MIRLINHSFAGQGRAEIYSVNVRYRDTHIHRIGRTDGTDQSEWSGAIRGRIAWQMFQAKTI